MMNPPFIAGDALAAGIRAWIPDAGVPASEAFEAVLAVAFMSEGVSCEGWYRSS